MRYPSRVRDKVRRKHLPNTLPLILYTALLFINNTFKPFPACNHMNTGVVLNIVAYP